MYWEENVFDHLPRFVVFVRLRYGYQFYPFHVSYSIQPFSQHVTCYVLFVYLVYFIQ